ncbi:MAG: hypothetical protein WD492_08675 [Alkalispirochaeta sp.]
MTKILTATIPTPTTQASRFRAGPHRVLLCLVVAGLLLKTGSFGISAQANLELYRQLAVDLSEQAAELHDDNEARRDLARRAAELDPSLGDPLVILAGLLEGEQGAQRERERLLARALAGDFVTLSRDEAVGDMAELLLQQNRSQEALTLLDSEMRIDGETPLQRILGYVDLPDQPAKIVPRAENLSPLDRLYISALMNGDAPWFAGRLVQRLRGRFPMDRVLGGMDWARSSHISLGVLEWVDAVEQLTGEVSAEMYRELLRADPPRSLVQPLLDRYRRAEGDDPLVAAFATVYGSEVLPQMESLLSDKVMWELFFEYMDRANLPDTIGTVMEEIRGRDRVVLTRDENRDGYWEERYSYQHGELFFWQLDADQDGLASVAVSLCRPSARVARRRESAEDVIVVDFTSYPLVSRVRWVESSGGWEWVPPQPVPFDVGLSDQLGADLWNALGRRVTVDSDVFERFFRQRQGDNSRPLDDGEVRDLRVDLREWGLIE